ncbi:MAG: tetratricopeptide repeat protein [Candidatus Omnitrophota bacterium]
MKCEISFHDLSRYADNACTLKQTQAVNLHISQCDKCRHALIELMLLKKALSSLSELKESEHFDFEFNQKLNRRLEQKLKVSLNSILEKTLQGINNVFIPRAPVLARVAALLLLAVTVVGSYNYYIYTRLPLIQNVVGQAKICQAPSNKWIAAKPNIRLRESDRILTAQDSEINILSQNKYAARIKSSSDIVIAKLDLRAADHFTEFSVAKGKLMVNTRKHFKGSKMMLSTPSCKASVVGTAFAIDVSEAVDKATWLGVLEGTVKIHANGADIYVNAGQKSKVLSGSAPDAATLLSDAEWDIMQELYQLGEKPQVVLLVSLKVSRVKELLKPAPLYISDAAPRVIPRDLETITHLITKAIENNDTETHNLAIRRLERLVEGHSNSIYNPQFLMFIGSYYYYMGNYKKAIATFERVVKEYPEYALSSLAQRAIAEIYNTDLKDQAQAVFAFEKLLREYPDSVDAQGAKEFLKK